jgi:predicted SprT family Zn-dependent metalloprotease
MKLPKKIKVGDKWYSVEVVEAMVEKGFMGKVYYPEQKIKIGLSSTQTGKKYKTTDVQDTFWHELVHAILYDMGYDTLNRNEEFVHGFAKRLTKAIETAKFND